MRNAAFGAAAALLLFCGLARAASAQVEAFAKAMGYPTRHTAAELEAFLAKNLDGYKPVGSAVPAKLDAPVRVPVKLARGNCYFMVLRLGEGANFSEKAEAGYDFEFEPKGAGTKVSGGPGLHGPGGAGSGGCPQQDGDYDFVLHLTLGSSDRDLGTGPATLQLFAKPVSDKKLGDLKADQDRQLDESRRFKEEQQAKENARALSGCNACNARYQGCRGAHRSVGSCQADFRSCAFEKIGASWMSACRVPMD